MSTLGKYFHAYVHDHHNHWEDVCPDLMAAYNLAVHHVTRMSLYYALCGHEPWMEINIQLMLGVPEDADSFALPDLEDPKEHDEIIHT